MPKITIDGREYEVLSPGAQAEQPAAPKTLTINGRQFEVISDDPADDPSFEGGLTRAAAQGLTFGFGDELEAGAKYLAGGDYQQELKRTRRKLERFREQHPYLSFGAELAGGAVVPIGAGANLARQGLTVANLARGATRVGAPTGALFGLGAAEGIDSPEEAIGPAIGGALTGAAGYAVATPVMHGLARGGRATYDAVRDAFDPRGAGARKVAESFDQAGISMDQMRRAIAPELSNALASRGLSDRDMSTILQRAAAGDTHRAIAQDFNVSPRTISRYVAAFEDMNDIPSNFLDVAQDVAERAGRTGGARPITDLGRAAVAVGREGERATERLMQRQVEQPGRVMSQLQRAAGGEEFEATYQRLENVINNQARSAYQRAHAGNPQVSIGTVLNALQRQAGRRAGDIRRGMDQALALFRDQRGRSIATLRRYVDARQALDQMIESSRGANARATPLTRELQGIRARLNTTVRSQNIALAEADDMFSGARGAQGLLELGRSLVARAGARSTRELRGFRGLQPAQRQMIRLGFLERMADDVANKRLGNETVGQFRTPAGMRLIREIVGGDEAERLISDIRREALTTKTLRDLYSGSRTAPLSEDMKAFEENAQLAASALTGNIRGVATSLATRLRRQIGSRQAREILDMLSTTEQAELLRVLDEIEAGGRALAVRQGATGLIGLGGGVTAAGQAGQLQAPR